MAFQEILFLHLTPKYHKFYPKFSCSSSPTSTPIGSPHLEHYCDCTSPKILHSVFGYAFLPLSRILKIYFHLLYHNNILISNFFRLGIFPLFIDTNLEILLHAMFILKLLRSNFYRQGINVLDIPSIVTIWFPVSFNCKREEHLIFSIYLRIMESWL